MSVAIIRMGIPALMPLIKEGLRLTRTEVGFVSSVLNGGAAVAGIPVGKAVDRLGERWVIAYVAMASGFFIMGVNWASTFMMLLPVLLLTGVATGSSAPAGGKAIIGWFPERERGTAMGLRQMATPLGGAIAAMTLPPLALTFGWRFAFVFAGIFAIGIGLGALYLYKEPPGLDLRAGEAQATGFKELLLRKDIWAVLIYVFILAGGQWCYLTYLLLYLTENVHLPLTLAGSLLAVGQLCGAAGRIVWGFLSDRAAGGRRGPVLLLIGLVTVFLILVTSLFSPKTPVWLVSLTVALLGLTLRGWNGLTLTLASELVGVQVAGLAVGLTNTVGYVGIIALPPVFGFLVDQTNSYRLAWMVLAGMIMIALVPLRWAKEGKGENQA
ncbi:MAG: MFS transporter [Candidatus Rokubacteria bacterium]|nr:MFS transporter [Candidatus Rokubacteria bacterium]